MRKVIVLSGLSCSGKTHYAQSLGFPNLNYDLNHNYVENTTDYDGIRRWGEEQTSSTLVLDGWGFSEDSIPLADLLGADEVEVRFLYMNLLQTMLLQRERSNQGEYPLPYNPSHHYAFMQRNARGVLQSSLRESSSPVFMYRNGESLLATGKTHFEKTFSSTLRDDLVAYINYRSGDARYQTVELEGQQIIEGYMNSESIWSQILGLGINFHDRKVADLGCFNGYFSFKVEQVGAESVTGYDVNEPAIEIATNLALLKQSRCKFRHADLVGTTPEKSEVLLLLNVLHHIAEGREAELEFLRRVLPTCFDAVLLLNPEQVPKPNAIPGYTQLRVVDSHLTTKLGQRKLVHYRGVTS